MPAIGNQSSGSLSSADSVVIAAIPNAVLRVTPGLNCTCKVQFSNSQIAALRPNSDAANWFDWPNGEISAQASVKIDSTVKAIKIMELTGNRSSYYEHSYLLPFSVNNPLVVGNGPSPSPTGVYLGDSQFSYSMNPVGPTAVTYDPDSGLLTLTKASHGLITGARIFFGVRAAPVWNNYFAKATVVDSSHFTVQGPVGQAAAPTTADIRYGKLGESLDNGMYSWVQSLTNGTLNILRIAAVTGETCSQIRARIPAEVLPLNPGVVFLQGGHNDLTATTLTPAQIFAELSGATGELVKAGCRVIVYTVTPVGSGYAANTVAIRVAMIELNRLIRTLPELYPGVAVVDAYGAGVDASQTSVSSTSGAGTARAGYIYSDNLHWSAQLVKAMATLTATVINTWFPGVQRLITSALDCYDSTNNPNSSNKMENAGLLTVTGGSVNSMLGAMGLRWNTATDQGSPSSFTASVQASSWGWAGNSAKISWGAGLVFNLNVVRIFASSQHTRFSPGQKVKFRGRLKTAACSGLIYYCAVYLFCTVDGSTYSVGAAHDSAGGVTLQPQAEVDNYYESDVFPIPEGATLSSLYWQATLALTGTSLASSSLEVGEIDFVPVS